MNSNTQLDQNAAARKALSTTQKFADERVLEKAQEAIYRCQELDATSIHLSVYDGVIQMEGTVQTDQMIKVAEDCMQNIKGVRGVDNDLTVRAIDKNQLS